MSENQNKHSTEVYLFITSRNKYKLNYAMRSMYPYKLETGYIFYYLIICLFRDSVKCWFLLRKFPDNFPQMIYLFICIKKVISTTKVQDPINQHS